MSEQPQQLMGKVVVITGASSGIGRAAALAFARQGAHVVCAARGRVSLVELTEQIIAEGGSARAVPTDVSDPSSVATLVQASVAAYGGIDVWINNAGVMAYGGVEDLLTDDYERLVLINYLGQVYGTCAVLPTLRHSSNPVIMGVVGLAGFAASPHANAGYAASKFALRGFYLSLQEELAATGDPVAVVMIHPDAVSTPLYRHARRRGHGQPQIPAQMYHPEVVAHAMVQAALSPRRQVIVGGRAAAAIATSWLTPTLRAALAQMRHTAVQCGLPQRVPEWVQQWVEDLAMSSTRQMPAPHTVQAGAASLVRTIMGMPAAGAQGRHTVPAATQRDNFEQPSPAPGQVRDELPTSVRGWSRYATWSGQSRQVWQWARAEVRQWWDRPLHEQAATAEARPTLAPEVNIEPQTYPRLATVEPVEFIRPRCAQPESELREEPLPEPVTQSTEYLQGRSATATRTRRGRKNAKADAVASQRVVDSGA